MDNHSESKLMANEICRYIDERRNEKELALLIKKDKGEINKRLEVIADNLLGASNDQLMAIKKEKKNSVQTALEFQHYKYQTLMSILDNFSNDNHVVEITDEYKNSLLEINKEHKPNVWLNKYSEKAKDVSFATHVAKLTHSSSKGSSILDNTKYRNNSYLSTNTLKQVIVDAAIDNNASAPAAAILNLEINGKKLLNYVKETDQTPFEKITNNQNEIDEWMSGFKKAADSEKKSSHFLSKQVYFSTGEDSYHLLLPLVSSSMAHTLHLKFNEFFNDENEIIRKQRKNNKFHDKLYVSYPNRASLRVTASNHSNASSLIGKRAGKLKLLNSTPPQWNQKQPKPEKLTNLFNRNLGFRIKEEIDKLQRLLLAIKSNELSMNKPAIHRAITNSIIEISDSFFDEIMMVNMQMNKISWTIKSKLPLSQQLVLEPNREDEIATQEKQKRKWSDELAEDFSFWLNKQLIHKKLNLTPIQQSLWKDLFKPKLREYIAKQESVS